MPSRNTEYPEPTTAGQSREASNLDEKSLHLSPEAKPAARAVLSSKERSGWRRFLHPRLYAVLAALSYILLVNLFLDFGSVFEFDPDEGNNLIKTLLLDQGYLPGSQIWSDQPPGYTYFLWGVFRIFGWSVAVARQTVLCFAGIAVFVVYDVLRSSSRDRAGHPAAIAGCAALILSTLFIRLSVSVMIGLPAIAMMMLAVWSLNEYLRSQRQHWLVLCGALMGLSLGIKLFTVFLVPLYGLFLLVSGGDGRRQWTWWHQFRPVILLAAGFLVVVGFCFSPMLPGGNIAELVGPHLTLRVSRTGNASGLNSLLGFLRQDMPLFTLALLGIFQALRTRNKSIYLWILWIVSAVAVLYDHAPVWGHHRLLLTAPGALLAGFAIGEMVAFSARRWPGKFSAGWAVIPAVAFTGLLIFYHLNPGEDSPLPSRLLDRSLREHNTQKVIDSYLPDIKYMVSARQMFAFRANRPVPPNLAVTSNKRFRSGSLKAEDIIESIREYHPELILITDRWNIEISKAVRNAINNDYVPVFRDQENRNLEIWVLKNLKKKVEGEIP